MGGVGALSLFFSALLHYVLSLSPSVSRRTRKYSSNINPSALRRKTSSGTSVQAKVHVSMCALDILMHAIIRIYLVMC